jgi:hypothetical protein
MTGKRAILAPGPEFPLAQGREMGDVDRGFRWAQWIENDSDLDSIRGHPRFKALVDSLE